MANERLIFLACNIYSILAEYSRWASGLLLLFVCFGFYDNLKFPLTYNGKNENWHLLLSHCRYFDKSFAEMFLEKSSTKPINCVHTAEFILVAMATKRLICEQILKSHLLRSRKGDEIETLQKYS